MTIEKLRQRRADLEKELAQHQAMVHAVSGAIQDCDWWITQMRPQSVADITAACPLCGLENGASIQHLCQPQTAREN